MDFHRIYVSLITKASASDSLPHCLEPDMCQDPKNDGGSRNRRIQDPVCPANPRSFVTILPLDPMNLGSYAETLLLDPVDLGS